jgi:DNA repair protein SbcC/Rad50
MIEHIQIRNWQSLRALNLDLGRLNVIVGPSSSGKTALMRALRAITSNMRGATAITRGQRSTAITVRTAEHQVTLERTETVGTYRLVDLTTGAEKTFTKLAGAVPAAISAALGIDPTPHGTISLHFAGQFDRPYLLDDSGAAVARVLGELTNVTRLLEAVREANRRRNTHAAQLRVREADLAALREQAQAFVGLPAQLADCQRAERFAEDITGLAERITRLHQATTAAQTAQEILTRAIIPGPLPTDTAARVAQQRMVQLQAVLHTWQSAQRAITAADALVRTAIEHETRAHAELHATLQAAGTCPTCGQPIRPA